MDRLCRFALRNAKGELMSSVMAVSKVLLLAEGLVGLGAAVKAARGNEALLALTDDIQVDEVLMHVLRGYPQAEDCFRMAKNLADMVRKLTGQAAEPEAEPAAALEPAPAPVKRRRKRSAKKAKHD